MFHKIFLNYDMTSYNFLYEYQLFEKLATSLLIIEKFLDLNPLHEDSIFVKILIPIKLYGLTFTKALLLPVHLTDI